MQSINSIDSIRNYLKADANKESLRFITCGSVDDGKSTLIGRLLYETKAAFEDQIEKAKYETKKYGTTDEMDFALLVDGLKDEKLQGITIDVAYRYFYTNKRKYIIADTPGHEQYTRNMATGASNAELAIILIDARKGVLTQTKRHSFIVTLMGIQHILVAVNKMDLIDYKQEVFEKIKKDFIQMFDKLRLALPYKNLNYKIDFIPISALKGDNVVKKSYNMPWYEGKSLLEYLDDLSVISISYDNINFRFPVQYVNRANLDFRGYCGEIVGGKIKENDEIVVYPSKQRAKVKNIIPISDREEVYKKGCITFTTYEDIDVSRGDLICKPDESLPYVSNSFEAMLIVFDKELENQEYILKIYTKETIARISRVLYRRDVHTLEKERVYTLKLNDIARVKIDLNEEVAFDFYEENKNTGAFILIDKLTNNTVAAGMIVGIATKGKKRVYTQAEIELNRYIRKFYPEWGCRDIEEVK
ncbi:sulfate adenylyltransferase subunit 1 [Hippea jasoniae]|uniref:sulfate adenylyltransferase subunit 1 n=1 Tax=Hippea jasoniae TaxID=944479 RepID=UPI000553D6FA|nr:GTP-binding protein [Hippea jasoniae]